MAKRPSRKGIKFGFSRIWGVNKKNVKELGEVMKVRKRNLQGRWGIKKRKK